MSVINSKARVFYAVLPKAACTSIKTLLWELETGQDSTRASLYDRVLTKLGRRPKPFRIHHIEGYFALEFGKVTEVPEGYERICVVRDPLARLRSAWANKSGREVFATRGESKIVEAAGLELDPTFGYFVENLDRYREISRPAWIHTRRYAWHLGPRLDWYDHVFKMEDIGAFERYISDRVGAETRLPRRNETGGLSRALDLQERHIGILREWLAPDYALLDGRYDFDAAIERLFGSGCACRPSASPTKSSASARSAASLSGRPAVG